MKKILFGLGLLLFSLINSHPVKSEEQPSQLYCMDSESYQPKGPYIFNLLNNKGCSNFSEKSILIDIDKELWQKLRGDSNASYNEIRQYNKNIYQTYFEEKIKELEKIYSKNCEEGLFKKGFKKGTPEYDSCLYKEEKIALNKKKQLEEKKLSTQKKTEAIMANMKPEERRAYICENTYGFRKGSDKFSDCVFKIMNAEVELQKLELQKKLAEAQQETARANESAARANASRSSTPSYDPNVAAAMERTNEIERAKILLNLGQALRTPAQNNAPAPQRNCRVNPVNGYINCW